MDVNAAPESLELQLLREIREEMREEREETRRQFRAMRADINAAIQGVRELAIAQGFEIIIPVPRPTPPPGLAESWAPGPADGG